MMMISIAFFCTICVISVMEINIEFHIFLFFTLFSFFSALRLVFDYKQTYADEGHELTNVLEHVYKSMEHYLKECLSLDPDNTKSEDANST